MLFLLQFVFIVLHYTETVQWSVWWVVSPSILYITVIITASIISILSEKSNDKH